MNGNTIARDGRLHLLSLPGRTAGVLLSTAGPVLLATFLVELPFLFLVAWIVVCYLRAPDPLRLTSRDNGLFLFWLRVAILDPMVGAAVAGAVVARLRGIPVPAWAGLSVAGRRTWRILGAHTLFLALLALPAHLLLLATGPRVVLLAAPALLAGTWIGPLVATVEGTAPWTTLRRALGLTRGNRLRAFLLGAFPLVLEFLYLGVVESRLVLDPHVAGFAVAAPLGGILVSLFAATAWAIAYHDLLYLEMRRDPGGTR